MTLPSDFGDMIYPLTSLMVEASAKGLPYYSEDSTEDEADSFWFSMAVLASLMNDYVKDFTVDTDENYLYLEEDTVNMYASTLYDAYAQGIWSFRSWLRMTPMQYIMRMTIRTVSSPAVSAR